MAIRVDGGLRLGAGHVARCLSLARGLAAAGAHVELLSSELDEPLRRRVLTAGFGISDLPSSRARQREATCRSLSRTDVLVVDHYELGEEDERAFSSYVPRVVAFDDRPSRRHHTHVLVDTTLGRTESDYAGWVEPGTELLLGSRYALVAPEIGERREEARIRRAEGEAKNLLICLGGACTPQTLERLTGGLVANAIHERFQIRLVGGMALDEPTLARLRAQLGQDACLPGYVGNVPDLLLWADVAVGAAGVSTWERCTLGLPTVLLRLADNQEQTARAVVSSGAALDGGGPDVDAKAIAEGLDRLQQDPELYRETSDRAFQICDGGGVERTCTGVLGDPQRSAT